MSTKEVVEKNLLEQQGQGQAGIRGIYGSIEDLKDMGTVCVPQHGVKATLMPGEYNPSCTSSGWREKGTERSRRSVGSSFPQSMLWLPRLAGSQINPIA